MLRRQSTSPFLQGLNKLQEFIVAFVFLTALVSYEQSMPALSSVSPSDWLFIAIIALVSGAFSLSLYYWGLQHTRASIATLAELGFPLAAVFVNAYFIASVPSEGTYFGLYLGQWIGTALLLGALYMLSRVNQNEESVA